MLSSFKKYLENLRASDDDTINTHATRWSLIISIIILAIVFSIWGKDIFLINNNQQNSDVNGNNPSNNGDYDISKIESPWVSLKNIFRDMMTETQKIKENIANVKEAISTSSIK